MSNEDQAYIEPGFTKLEVGAMLGATRAVLDDAPPDLREDHPLRSAERKLGVMLKGFAHDRN